MTDVDRQAMCSEIAYQLFLMLEPSVKNAASRLIERHGISPKPEPEHFQGGREKVLAAVRGGEWREDVRAASWVGYAVAGALGLDIGEAGQRDRIKGLVRTWIKNGALIVVRRRDEGGKSRAFVEARGAAE